jgi:serine/threonine-protein kinase
MDTHEAATFAQAAHDLGLLDAGSLVRVVLEWSRYASGSSLQRYLVDTGELSEEEVLRTAKATGSSLLEPRLKGPQYTLGSELGRGANGVVIAAEDGRLGRTVAMKLHGKGLDADSVEFQRFTHEAQVTGQLAHPGVVPVHDLGVLPDGRCYYTMKRIEGDTLQDVFSARRRGDEDALEAWTVSRFAIVLLRVAQALAFAHDRGVIHRDVKPANIMVGDYGEVLLLDWGVARVLGESAPGHAPVSTWRWEAASDLTMQGTVAGTPAYMPPEQADGNIAAISGASDVYAVGVVLYEFLARSRPFRGKSIREVLRAVIEGDLEPPSARRPRDRIPAELESLCLKCMEKRPEDRYPNGGALTTALEQFLDGSRRRLEAQSLGRRGLANSEAYVRAAEATSSAEDRMRAQRDGLPPWAGASLRQRAWESEHKFKKLRELRDDTYDEAIALLQAAVERDADLPEARAGLASLYLRRMEQAEARGEHGAARFFKRQVVRYDSGALKRVLQGPSQLVIKIDPPHATATLARLKEDCRVLRPIASTRLDLSADAEPTTLGPGIYLLTASAPGRASIQVSLRVDRPARLEPSFRLPQATDIADRFVVVPGGLFDVGGDPLALDGAPKRTTEVSDFAIGRHPITQAEYREWLVAEGAAAGHSGWSGPDTDVEVQADLPALGVSYDAAEAFAEWRSRVEGRRFSLPTHDQWERAARGGDRRVFPWGDSWEPPYCNGPDGEAADSRPLPVGSRAEDCSPCGMADVAGGVHEWVLGAVPHRPDRGWLRGGSWNGHPRLARICSRLSRPRTSRGGTLGFRLVQLLD